MSAVPVVMLLRAKLGVTLAPSLSSGCEPRFTILIPIKMQAQKSTAAGHAISKIRWQNLFALAPSGIAGAAKPSVGAA